MQLVSIAPVPELTTWDLCFDATAAKNDGKGYKAGGFGHFDGVISNSKAQVNDMEDCDTSPNGGNPEEIEVADLPLTFRADLTGDWSLCDFLTEVSLRDIEGRANDAAVLIGVPESRDAAVH